MICLSRDNSNDAAVSFIIAENSGLWHDQYGILNDWIIQNKNKILEVSHRYDELKSKLKKYDLLQVTYENIYLYKKDIEKINTYLNIKSPLYLDMLDFEKKYRKDKINFLNVYKTKNII